MVRIGVTGHRFLAEVEKLQAGIDQALAYLDARYPGEAWSVISALAEGADRLVVERILAYRPAARLVVPLPMPEEAYQTDFSSTASRQEFGRYLARADEVIRIPTATSREEAYRAVGEYLVQHASVLIALWDGQGAQGKGGTGEIVARARESGLPLAWVQSGNRLARTRIPTRLGDRQGQVIFEGF